MSTQPAPTHTPTPWTHYDDSKSAVHRHQIAAMGKTVAHIYCTKRMEAEDEANAALIVRAVNSHETMFTALAFAQSVIKSGEPWTAQCDEIIGTALTAAGAK